MDNYQNGYDAYLAGKSFNDNESPYWRYGWMDAKAKDDATAGMADTADTDRMAELRR